MRLTDLLQGTLVQVKGDADIGRTRIDGLTSDSRQVEPGFLFAALPGGRLDGGAFVPDAIARGAAVVLAPSDATLPAEAAGAGQPELPLIVAENPRRVFAQIAAHFFGAQPETIAAVTGTNGKTSVVDFLRQIWSALGLRAASMGTLGVRAPGIEAGGQLTTPDPVELHRALAQLARADLNHLALEASSHGLDQHRLDGVRVQLAAFTNLSRDHLDYHRTMEHYFAAKQRLFTELLAYEGTAVLNADVAEADVLAGALSRQRRDVRILSYGEQGKDVRLQAAQTVPEGQRLTIAAGSHVHEIVLPLVGRFQSANALAALTLAIAAGADPAEAIVALPGLVSVRGRMERVVRLSNGAAIYVDYAHTPDGLGEVLRALRPHTGHRLVVVFGCGGDRDLGKRPEMGRIAAELADSVIVTDDNPRSEDAAAIRRQILAGCSDAEEIGDRAAAIVAAIKALSIGDILVVAGKGHETGQIVGDRVLPFDDAEVVRTCVSELGQ